MMPFLFESECILSRDKFWSQCPGADRYIFCGPMFVPAFVLSQPNFIVK